MQHAPTIPASGGVFLDRVAELERLDRALGALRAGRPRWQAIVGQRKIGKTSLLKEWIRRTPAGSVSWVTFDLFREAPGPAFLRRWVHRCVDAALSGEAGASLEAAAGSTTSG